MVARRAASRAGAPLALAALPRRRRRAAGAVSPARRRPRRRLPAGRSTYRIGIGQDCDGMNPFASWSGISWECFRLGYDFLTWYDADYEPVPDVATSWETSEDGMTWTFHIREGMKWQDGVPLTARDVAFTYNLILGHAALGVHPVPDRRHRRHGAGRRDAGHHHAARPTPACSRSYIPILPEHIWSKVDPDHLG